jgi:hypothetical protein
LVTRVRFARDAANALPVLSPVPPSANASSSLLQSCSGGALRQRSPIPSSSPDDVWAYWSDGVDPDRWGRGAHDRLRNLDRYGVDDALRAHIRTYIDQLFFYKNTDWAAEVAHCWVYLGDSPTPEFVRFGDALEGLCVGENYPAKPAGEDPSLRCLAEQFGITYIPRITWANGRVRVQTERSGGEGVGLHVDSLFWSGPRTRPLLIGDEHPEGDAATPQL